MQADLAHRLSVVAGEVYRTRPRLDAVLPGALVRAFHHGNTQSFVIDHPTMVVVAFRGTQAGSLADWWTDLRALTRRKLPAVPGLFHRGFALALDPIAFALAMHLQMTLAGRPLYLTGHSLGGALAVIFAAHLERLGMGDSLAGVYTFGAPRVASPRAAAWLNSRLRGRVHRFVNSGDKVPWVPPAVLGYRHSGDLYVVSDAGAIYAGSAAHAESAKGRVRRILRALRFAPHRVEEYSARLAFGVRAVA